ncbi:cytochrome P460 family protein [Ancylobacter sp. WKF20]|uniref:cytochrome P460 family protein n=1 Tax=Ancylobacter sp. WKF20 TaxID=3039801 RepID=UPI0024345BCF|nr:cytochrome P460 family protein [Ancylobacter sp. WKF20]WGD32238.1 cytochrome P460 family protein [Ancylobacter sp. WKF20]
MPLKLGHLGLIGLSLSAATLLGLQVRAEPTRVTFPRNIDDLVHYTTVTRGDVVEHMLTSREAIQAAQNGQPMPDGTQIILADYRNDKIYRYFVMEKGPGWGDDYDARRRTGDWQFQWYWPDGSINTQENTMRCQSCHQSRAEQNYMFTYRDLMNFNLSEVKP